MVLGGIVLGWEGRLLQNGATAHTAQCKNEILVLRQDFTRPLETSRLHYVIAKSLAERIEPAHAQRFTRQTFNDRITARRIWNGVADGRFPASPKGELIQPTTCSRKKIFELHTVNPHRL